MEEVMHIIVKGRVQGVGFRYHTESAARLLGVSGWVRNLPSGDVEILARVNKDQKEALLAAIHKGPPMARVEGMDIRKAPENMTSPNKGFSVRF
ncbi:MAG: acylphosphatase [Deltaproteobacteria bacterium]|nr:acylphosphatase [Deltaproteobacteria bacterium]